MTTCVCGNDISGFCPGVEQCRQAKASTECPICSGKMEALWEIPQMPLCETYEDRTVDQSFTYCQGCGHGKLGTIVPPAQLYEHGYAPSGKSIGSGGAISNFVGFIQSKLATVQFDCVVDIGGNDGSLLSMFPDKRCISIDPNASGKHERINEFIEDADLEPLKEVSKLICSSHTLEHIENPGVIFEKLSESVGPNDFCAFQFPSLEMLVADCRIDQIYHQHIHYYSLRSISLLLAKHGFKIIAYEFDTSHYGAIMVIFRKGLGEAKGISVEASRICRANDLFIAQMDALNDRLARTQGMIGYGASMMLPLLHYYLPALSALEYIVDEDDNKWWKRYERPHVEIRPAQDMAGKTVMVTAFNTKMAVRRIVQKLLSMNARDVIVPLNYL